MTFEEMMPDVRTLVRDTDEALHHYSDAQILHALVDAAEHLRSVRPAARYVRGVVREFTYPADIEALKALDPCVPARWLLGVRYFAAGRVFEVDTTDTVNMQLAASMFKKADEEFAR